MRAGSFRYLVREGMRSLWVNRLMSLASIGVLVSCLLLIGTSVLFSININSMVGYIENQNEVVVFLDDDMTDEKIKEIEEKIDLIENITDITFISKEEGLAEQMEIFGEDKEYFQGLIEDNPIPDSFNIRMKNLDILDDTLAKLEEIDGVYQVNAPTEVAGIVVNLKNIVSIAGIVVVGILITVSFLIIANTIKITVFNRRKEIGIMKYVGATDGFIRLPFFIEGLMLGLISGLFAYGLLAVGYYYLYTQIALVYTGWLELFFANMIPFADISLMLLLGMCGCSVLIGSVGSIVFVRKYLKV
ncbi:MAG: ABC transporter permease [Ruminococcaceae bacterium]|nr:ABC transporter permease [Oscillospiraceae bacterium]